MLATTEPREFTLIILYVLPVLIVLLSAVSNTTCSFLVVGGADFANDVNVGIWKIGESGQQCTSYHKSEIGFGAPGFARLVGFLGMLVNILLCYGMWESYRGRYAYRGGKRTLARMAIVASGLNGLQVFGMAVANACITAEKCDMGGGSWGGGENRRCERRNDVTNHLFSLNYITNGFSSLSRRSLCINRGCSRGFGNAKGGGKG